MGQPQVKVSRRLSHFRQAGRSRDERFRTSKTNEEGPDKTTKQNFSISVAIAHEVCFTVVDAGPRIRGSSARSVSRATRRTGCASDARGCADASFSRAVVSGGRLRPPGGARVSLAAAAGSRRHLSLLPLGLRGTRHHPPSGPRCGCSSAACCRLAPGWPTPAACRAR